MAGKLSKKIWKKWKIWRIRNKKNKTIKDKRILQRIEFERREKKELIHRERPRRRERKKIQKYIYQGNESFERHLLKEAYYYYEAARILAVHYDERLESISKEKIAEVRGLVHHQLRKELEIKLQKIDKLYQAGHFDDVKLIIQKIRRYLQKHAWAKIDGVLKDFQKIVLDR